MSPDRQPCRICGHLLQEQGRFCQNCGAEQEWAIGEPSAARIETSFPAARIVLSFFILILGVPGALIAAYVAGLFGACTIGILTADESAFAPISMVIGVAVFLLCMVAINALLKSVKR